MTRKNKWWLNTLRPRQNGSNFPGDIFKWIFLNENVCIRTKLSLKFVPALVQIMVWRRPGDKPLSECMMPEFIGAYIYICVTRSPWVRTSGSIHPQHFRAIEKLNTDLVPLRLHAILRQSRLMRYLNDTQRVWNTYLETTLFSNLHMAARKLLYTGNGMVLRYDMKK